MSATSETLLSEIRREVCTQRLVPRGMEFIVMYVMHRLGPVSVGGVWNVDPTLKDLRVPSLATLDAHRGGAGWNQPDAPETFADPKGEWQAVTLTP